MSAYIDRFKLSAEMDEAFEWQKWDTLIPYINWPSEWSVKARPPMVGAVIRYDIREDITGYTISIFLDCYNMLGALNWQNPTPYWEIYPSDDEDVERFAMEDVNGLLNGLRRSFRWQNSTELGSEEL